MKGILFKPDMIKAIVEGRKTQTRRLDGLREINQNPDDWRLIAWKYKMMGKFTTGFFFKHDNGLEKVVKPRYQVGEVVYIKEAWATENQYNHLKPRELPHTAKLFYLLDGYNPFEMGKKRSPLFMPAWVARYFIRITDVRAERLKEITPVGCLREGIIPEDLPARFMIADYAKLWDSINKVPYDWQSNPWVFVYFQGIAKAQ